MMYQSADSDPSVDVKVKDELEIGPTVLQQSFSHQNGLENQINDSCTIKLEHDADDEGTRKIKDCFEFETQESLGEVYFKSELDNLDYEDVKTVAATQPPTYQVGQQEPGRTTVGRPGGDSKLFSGALADEGSRDDADRPTTSKNSVTCTNAKQFSRQSLSEICNKSFTRLGDLKSHKCTDTGEKSHHCEICNESCTSLYTLQLHRRRIHTGGISYKCQKCKKRFTSAGQLSSHKCIHILAVDKIYCRKICNRHFPQLSDLKSHQRGHIADKPYHCEICNQSFTTMANFVQHGNIHFAQNIFNNNNSGTCSTSLNNLSSLKSHNIIGADDGLPYNCEKCNTSYARSGDLTRHKRSYKHKHCADIRQRCGDIVYVCKK